MNRRIKIKVAEYRKSIKNYYRNWERTDKILRNVCSKDFRQHNKMNIINSKVILVGRGFASGIERQIKIPTKNRTQGTAISILTKHIYKNRKKIDEIISSINSCHKLNGKSIQIISEAHGRFCNILKDITRKSKKNHKHIPISFVSKYLHFHCPIVPIYDYFANNKIKNWIDKQNLIKISKTKNGNDEYLHYLKCIHQIYNELLNRGVRPKPTSRYVEYYALWSSNKEMP